MNKLTLEDYFMDSRNTKYPEECTDKVIQNSIRLVSVLNDFLQDLMLESNKDIKIAVSSGWRPLSLNSGVKGAAKRSYHTLGLACDFYTQELGLLILNHPDLLKKYGLWLEDVSKTTSWTHLDLGHRSDRKINIFIP